MSHTDSGVPNIVMICPKCKKKETSILKTLYESLTNTVKRQRKCNDDNCGNLFVTYEIDKSGLKSKSAKILKSSIQLKKKRKPTVKENWIDFKVFLYGFMRLTAIISSSISAVDKFDKKFKSGKDTFLTAEKSPNKKSFFSVFNTTNKDYSRVKIEGVKQTIKKCIGMKIYWETKKKLFKNIIIPDLKQKRIRMNIRDISDEINQYNRSITSYVRKEKYDTPDFFNNNHYFDKIINDFDLKITKEEVEILRTKLFTSQKWIWYTEVR